MADLAPAPRKTVADLLALPLGTRAELIGGELTLNSHPFVVHQAAVGALGMALGTWAGRRRAGRVYLGQTDVYLPSGDVVEPDLVFVGTANLGILQDWIRGVPDLIVEVLSPSEHERDRVLKRALYQRNRVPEYWIVDPEARTIEILRLTGARLVRQALLRGKGVATSPALPGLRLRVATVFQP